MYIDVVIEPDYPKEVIEKVIQAEKIGFDNIFFTEVKHDPFILLSLATTVTKNIGLGTSIALAFTRSPMNLAYSSWDIQRLSNGRLILGLGSQVKPHIERRFGLTWDKPINRMRETIESLRMIWKSWQENKRVNYKVEIYSFSLMPDFFNPGPNRNPEIDIYLAAVNNKMCMLVGELADGIMIHPFHSVNYIEENIIPNITEGVKINNRSMKEISKCASIMTITGESQEEIEQLEMFARMQIAFYGSTPAYRGVLESCDAGDLQERLNLLSKEGKWAEMAKMIDNDILNNIAVIAESPELAAKEIKKRYEGKGDRLTPALYSDNPELAPALLKALKL